MQERTSLAIALSILVALGAVGTVASATQQAGTAVEVTASPTDWDEPEATHAVVFTVESDAASAREPVDNLVVDYESGSAPADVGNVGPEDVRWIGIDRDGDDPGTRVNTRATVTEVSDTKDGQALRIETAGDLNVLRGDEVVAVYGGVQHPQDQGATVESTVNVTLNEGGAGDLASSSVTYEYDDANVSMSDQETSGDSVTVDSVSLSEPGFVVVLNESGRNPDAIRGATYLGTGTHQDVEVPVDPVVSGEEELAVQVHLDTDGDRRFGYGGGPVDRPFEDRDGNLLATDTARVSGPVPDDGTATPGTATPGTASPTPTETAVETVTVDGTGEETPTGEDPSADSNGTTDAPTAVTSTGTETGEGDNFSTIGSDETEDTDGDGAGFSVLTGLVALVGAALLVRRRR
jgi:PGF-CTERM protein